MLSVQGLTKYFGDLPAVLDLSFEVNGGEIVGLLGPNGAGKTTTLRCIASILQPDAGTITICGHDLLTDTEDAKRAFAYVPELPHPYETLTVMEHLRFVAAAFDTEDELVHANELLDGLDLLEKKSELAATLSKGMRQKLSFACAFLHRPQVFCFDEPLIGIDPKGSRLLKDLLVERRAAGCAILISTHMLDTAERLCDRVIIVHKGQVISEGTVNELQAMAQMDEGATLEDIFLRLTAAED